MIFHPAPTFRVADEPFSGQQMTELTAKFRVTDEPFLGSQMTSEPQQSPKELRKEELADLKGSTH